jgi:hypothetical protein
LPVVIIVKYVAPFYAAHDYVLEKIGYVKSG